MIGDRTLKPSRVLELYDYDRSTGKFYWRINPSIRNIIGKEAGMVGHRNSRTLCIDGGRHQASKIVWLLEHGELPSFRIGYADGNPGNFAISNLVALSRPKYDKQDITQSELKKLLHYEPETGKFTWLSRPLEEFTSPYAWTNWENGYVGKEAGHVNERGYVSIRLLKRLYKAHRLAWLYVYGSWPKQVIDHINGNPTDNRIDNLRDVSVSVNIQNIRKPTSSNKVGVLGVNLVKETGKYAAYIQINGRSVGLGYFDSPEKAGAAYLAAKRKHHEGCTI